MDFYAYLSQARAIHVELAQIADRMSNMAIAKLANGDNAEFAGLMTRHSGLIKRLQLVDEEFLRLNPQYAG